MLFLYTYVFSFDIIMVHLMFKIRVMSIEHLKKRINKYKDTHFNHPEKRIKHYKVTSSIICMEIVAAVITGFFFGYILDLSFNTKYIFKIICLIFAFMGYFTVLYKIARN